MEGWEHVITAPDQTIGEMLKAMLEEEGIVAMLEPEDAVSFLGVSGIPVRLMVPVEQAPAARQFLEEFQDTEPDWQRDDDAVADDEPES